MGASTQQQFKSGSWTKEEDDRLRKGQAQFGNKWAKVAKYVKTRDKQQCAQRWRHAAVNPNILKQRWTPEEDSQLRALGKELGACWAAIAQRMPGRSDQQCRSRWKRLFERRPTKKPTARCQSVPEQETAETMGFNTGSDNASHTVVEETDQECKSSDCQVGQDSQQKLLADAEPDERTFGQKRCNTPEVVASDCNNDAGINKQAAKRDIHRSVLTRLISIDSDCDMTVEECAMVLMNLKHTGMISTAGEIQISANDNIESPSNQFYYGASQHICNGIMPPYVLHDVMGMPIIPNSPPMAMQHQFQRTDMSIATSRPRDVPIRVYTEALPGCAAMFGCWVNRDSYWEGHHPRPLFRRCDSTFINFIDPKPIEAFELWNTSSVPAKVILGMWMRLKLGEMIIIHDKEFPAGTLFDKVMKKLKELKGSMCMASQMQQLVPWHRSQ